MKTFPTLYQKTNTGAIQFWKISVELDRMTNLQAGIIKTEYGQLGTDKPQVTTDLVTKGKNEGKKNATTALQQAELEGLAKWEKQKKKGYVETVEEAEAGTVDTAFVEGGIEPMLAKSFDDDKKKIKYPCAVQPKLDGIRCVATIVDGKVSLWSRTRKPIRSVPHIVAALEKQYAGKTVTLDGELYNHEYKDNFEQIVSLVRQEEPGEGHEKVEYHVYDVASDTLPFDVRVKTLSFGEGPVKAVLTKTVNSESEVIEFAKEQMNLGYEGGMARNLNSLYEFKRSGNLQKVKFFLDAEFEIIGVNEGRGKMAGHGIFICKNEAGTTFECKMEGELEKLAEVWRNKEAYLGQRLTVKYQGLTNKNKVPRFPVGLRLRAEGF